MADEYVDLDLTGPTTLGYEVDAEKDLAWIRLIRHHDTSIGVFLAALQLAIAKDE